MSSAVRGAINTTFGQERTGSNIRSGRFPHNQIMAVDWGAAQTGRCNEKSSGRRKSSGNSRAGALCRRPSGRTGTPGGTAIGACHPTSRTAGLGWTHLCGRDHRGVGLQVPPEQVWRAAEPPAQRPGPEPNAGAGGFGRAAETANRVPDTYAQGSDGRTRPARRRRSGGRECEYPAPATPPSRA